MRMMLLVMVKGCGGHGGSVVLAIQNGLGLISRRMTKYLCHIFSDFQTDPSGILFDCKHSSSKKYVVGGKHAGL